MTRMSREFSLVLLGAGILSAGYLAWPEEDLQKTAEAQAARRVGGRPTSSGGHFLVFIHTSGGSHSVTGTRSAAMASVSRGGFGAVGGRVSGGGGG